MLADGCNDSCLDYLVRDLAKLEQYRRRDIERNAAKQRGLQYTGDVPGFGCFSVSSKIDGQQILIILSCDHGDWDHVSVSRKNRIPNWIEMEQVRRICFEDYEAVMQYHPPLVEYVDGKQSGCEYCLHLWRPIKVTIPKPPKWMVGGMTMDEAERAAKAEGF